MQLLHSEFSFHFVPHLSLCFKLNLIWSSNRISHVFQNSLFQWAEHCRVQTPGNQQNLVHVEGLLKSKIPIEQSIVLANKLLLICMSHPVFFKNGMHNYRSGSPRNGLGETVGLVGQNIHRANSLLLLTEYLFGPFFGTSQILIRQLRARHMITEGIYHLWYLQLVNFDLTYQLDLVTCIPSFTYLI